MRICGDGDVSLLQGSCRTATASWKWMGRASWTGDAPTGSSSSSFSQSLPFELAQAGPCPSSEPMRSLARAPVRDTGRRTGDHERLM